MRDMHRRSVLGALATGGVAVAGLRLDDRGRLVGSARADAAPNPPGETPFWTTGEKYGFGTVQDHPEGSDDASTCSNVWYTLTEGALTEARFPRVDLLDLRTVDFVVADGDPDSTYARRSFDVDLVEDDGVEREATMVEEDALVFEHRIADSDPDRGWELRIEYAADPGSDSIVLDVEFAADDGREYDLYAVVDPALSAVGYGDLASREGEEDEYHLTARSADVFAGDPETADPVLLDEDGEHYVIAAAVAARDGFEWATVDYVGGDAITALVEEGDDSTAYDELDEDGNVVLAGRLASETTREKATLAIGFAEEGDADEAYAQASDALSRSYRAVRSQYVVSWRRYLGQSIAIPDSVRGSDLEALYRTSAMVLKGTEDKTIPGAGIASPSVPWGEALEASEPGDFGYNFVWSRDAYQVFTALELAGDVESAVALTNYLYEFQQDEEGFLPQNTFLQGETRWPGEQMDNISYPAVMAYQLAERHDRGFDHPETTYDYANVRLSAEYVVRNGPWTEQERWEEEPGYSPSTIAAEIAGLVCAAELAERGGEREDALLYLGVADRWAERVEELCITEEGYDPGNVPDDQLAEFEGLDLEEYLPYYFRINSSEESDDGSLVELNNGGPTMDERACIDAGFLELPRLGIKPWDDSTIQRSVELVDEVIRYEFDEGPGWRRYNGDGYGEATGAGETIEGEPWRSYVDDPVTRGRVWPFFTGERGEYELLRAEAGENAYEPRDLLETIASFANTGRMLPEQVWEAGENPYGWERGQGTGSATPLGWTHAQFMRLAHAIDAGRPPETPVAVEERYDDLPEGPSLTTEVSASDGPVTVSGETDGERVVIAGPEGRATPDVDDGRFSAELSVPNGDESEEGDGDDDEGESDESRVTVVAATAGERSAEIGTAMESHTID